MTKKSDETDLRLNKLIKLIDQLHEHKLPKDLVIELGRIRETPGLVTPKKRQKVLTSLSKHLLKRIREVTAIETDPEGATVRSKRVMPRSVIAATAMEIFDATSSKSQVATNLRSVFAELLNVKEIRSGTSREANARHTAEILRALFPKMTNRDMARRLDVSHVTISNWRSDPDFKKWVKILSQDMANPDDLQTMKDAVRLHFVGRKELLPELD
jgi:hypothetical protein